MADAQDKLGTGIALALPTGQGLKRRDDSQNEQITKTRRGELSESGLETDLSVATSAKSSNRISAGTRGAQHKAAATRRKEEVDRIAKDRIAQATAKSTARAAAAKARTEA